MAISYYTRAAKETPIGVDVTRPLTQLSNTYSQQQTEEKQERKEAEAKYLQQAKIDPVYNMSTYWQKEQGKQIQDFHNYLADVYFRSKNKPTIQDQIDIQAHKSALFGWQQQLTANQSKYADAAKLIANDPYGMKFDKEYFNNKVNKWIDSGELDDDLLLPPKIGDRKGYYVSQNWKGTKMTTVTDNRGIRTEVEQPMTEEELKAKHRENLFNPKNAGLYRTVTEDFANAPIDEKKKYLDKYTGSDDKLGNAIVDWDWDTAGKYAKKQSITTRPAPKGKGSGYGQGLTGSIDYETPSDKLDIEASKTEGVSIPRKVDVWGNFSFPGSIAGAVTAREYYDMKTGEKQKVDLGQDIIIKYPEIKYVPVVGNKMIVSDKVDYRDENGNLKPGYKLKGVLITRSEEGFSQGLDFTPELKDKLKNRFKSIASEIDQIPYEIQPKGKQKAEKSAIKITGKTKITPERTATNPSTGEKLYQYKSKWYSKQEFDNLK